MRSFDLILFISNRLKLCTELNRVRSATNPADDKGEHCDALKAIHRRRLVLDKLVRSYTEKTSPSTSRYSTPVKGPGALDLEDMPVSLNMIKFCIS